MTTTLYKAATAAWEACGGNGLFHDVLPETRSQWMLAIARGIKVYLDGKNMKLIGTEAGAIVVAIGAAVAKEMLVEADRVAVLALLKALPEGEREALFDELKQLYPSSLAKPA